MTQPALHPAEIQARALVAARSTYNLVADFEETNKKEMSPELATVRGWIMDELESRDAAAFEAWMDSADPSPRAYFAR